MRYRVSFDIDIPVEATDPQVRQWIAFELHETASLPAGSPLADHDIEPVFGSLFIHPVAPPKPHKIVDSEFGPFDK